MSQDTIGNFWRTIRRTLNSNGVHGRTAKRKPVSKMNTDAHLQFGKDHMEEPEGYWKRWMTSNDIK